MRSLKGLPLDEIAFEVCSAFERSGIVAVLVGDGAAVLYAPKAYKTRDLDFVLAWELFRTPQLAVIEELGFKSGKSRGTYEHPDIPFSLEILPGPLVVGDEPITTYDTLHRGELVLHVITATDSVKDRLAAAIHWNDLNSAKQAAQIAKLNEINVEAVEMWCAAEGGSHIFQIFKSFMNDE